MGALPLGRGQCGSAEAAFGQRLPPTTSIRIRLIKKVPLYADKASVKYS
jgi:hypothetical protein